MFSVNWWNLNLVNMPGTTPFISYYLIVVIHRPADHDGQQN
jgi:hypothetical protein